VRVVAGSAGGLRLRAPAGRGARPTSERVREAIFSSLASAGVLAGASVVDLFAGSGALGIEALSRGAASATFVDADGAALAAVRDNLRSTRFDGTVVRADAVRFLETAPAYDIAFVDPPYRFEGWAELVARLESDVAVLESSREVGLGPDWDVVRRKRYGGTVVTLARRRHPTLRPKSAASDQG
jgi:16S rRNA (guanine966-N2)-methyltransferase